jgi:serine-type D-Ala-D-Ala carboxypeptidase (penicillin-binding protein 5/6)
MLKHFSEASVRSRILCSVASAFLSLVAWSAISASWAAKPSDPAAPMDTVAPFGIMIDAATGAVLYQKSADTPIPPASMIKLMTLEVIFHALKDGRVKFDDEYTVSSLAHRKGGDHSGATSMLLPVNGSTKVSDLVSGIAVASANDACIVMAEGLAGSEASFATMMNDEAKALGLANSHFTNSTGLPDPDQQMSVRDIATLAAHMIKTYPEYYSYFGQKNFTFNNKVLLNKNPLLSANIGVDGLKTGASSEGGLAIAASALSSDRRLIVVTSGVMAESERLNDAKKLFDWGFKNFKEATVFEDGEIVSEARVWGGRQYYVPLLSDGPARIVVPRSTAPTSRLKASLVYQGPLRAPVRKGDPVGYLQIETPEGTINKVPLYAANDVGRTNTIARGVDSLLIIALGWLLK